MNTRKVLVIVGGITVVVVVLRMLANFSGAKEANASGVTSTTKGGVKTTPVQTSKVVSAAPKSVLSLLNNIPEAVRSTTAKLVTTSKQFAPGANSYTTPFNNAQSAKAALTAPKRVDYTPSAYAFKYR